MSKHDRKLDQAARAAWLYYVAGRTQNEIADILGVSRQAAQRLVALASEQQIVGVSISHPIAECMDLAASLKKRFGLHECHVVPSAGLDDVSIGRLIAVCGAEVMMHYLRSEKALTVAVGSGRALRAAIDALPDMDRPQHTCVSLIGAIASDGSCTRYDVPLRMAEKTQGKYFILPAPMFADSNEDGALWRSHRIYQAVIDKAEQADVAFIGIG
ncbi:MAG: sugar-binding domain-containing protein, partial [Tolumonas sp.]